MKIRKKLSVSFGIPVLLILVTGIFFTIITQRALQNEIGESVLKFARKTISDIDKGIFNRIEGLQFYSESVSLAKVVDMSNKKFDKIFDVYSYINLIDKDWKEKKETPLIQKFLTNELSLTLLRYITFYKQKYGYSVIAEMYVTNKYGVVIGSTGRTSDFLQTDEEWYQNAVKEKDFWVGDVEYDESSDTFSVDIVVNLYDNYENFTGIVKAVLNVEDIRNTIYFIESESKYRSMTASIVNKNGLVIFKGLNPFLKDGKEDLFLEQFGEDISSRKKVGQAIKGEEGFGIYSEEGKELFSCFTHSEGFRNFKGLGWVLIIDYETDEILSNVLKFRRIIVTVFVISFIVAIFLSIVNAQSISIPIIKLRNASIKVGRGILDTKIEATNKDEIGELSVAFNKMTKNLQKITVSRNYVDNIFNSMTDILIVINPDTTIKTVNQAVFNLLGYEDDELIGVLIEKIFVKEERNDLSWKLKIQDSIKNSLTKDAESVLLTKDGRKIPVLLSGSMIYDNADKIQGIACVAKDISARKNLEKILASEKEYLKVTLHSIGDGVITTDNKGSVVILNKVAQELTGWTQEDAVGKPLTKVFHIINENTHELMENPVEVVLRERKIVSIGNATKLITNNGKEKNITDSAAPIINESGDIVGVVMVFQDISERKQHEKERQDIQLKMIQTSKLALLGEVAAGVAHEINQPLTYISSFIQSLKIDIRNNALDKDYLMEGSVTSLTQVDRIDKIIQHLRTFGRSEDIVKSPVCIETILNNTLLLIGERIRLRNIELVKNIESDLPVINGNMNQLEQVFINLFQNSIDAFLPKSKNSEIAVDILQSEDKCYVIIKIKDNGMGIEQECLDRIFEPFYTTKEVGKGTGLGLSIIYGIIEEHNGTIVCDSEVGKGTTFTIRLPVSDEG